MTTNYRSPQDIKATVKTDWTHHNCKFQPGAHAEVSAQVLPREWVSREGTIRAGRSHVSRRKQQRVAQVGEVVAVSCLPNGRIRSNDLSYRNGGATRMYTRYYIRFRDGQIMGYDSHHLKPAYSFA